MSADSSSPDEETRATTGTKRALRAEALGRRRAIDSTELASLSTLVGEKLQSLREYKDARLLISYCSKSDEVQTRQIIERALVEGRRVAVISTDVSSKTLSFYEIRSFEDELAPGAFGVLEPKAGNLRPVRISDADVILVPLVAWDEGGHRLGYGAGYFDRTLAAAVPRLTKIGLALESQRVSKVPEAAHDVRLDVIVTEERVIRPPRSRPLPDTRKDEKAFKSP